jgi:Domain of unknown function (DUF4389)
MSNLDTDPRTLPDPEAKPKGSIWRRGLVMLIVAILISLAQTVFHVLAVVQFVLMVFDNGKPNAQIASFGKTLGGWLAKAAAFQTAQTEAKPWPFEAHPSIASSSSMKPAIIDRPLSQNFGSLASRPKGASSSLWCIDPPAFSMAKYFS